MFDTDTSTYDDKSKLALAQYTDFLHLSMNRFLLDISPYGDVMVQNLLHCSA